MYKVLRNLLLPLAAVSLPFFLSAVTAEVFAGNDPSDSRITISSKLTNVSLADINEVKDEVRKALNSIPAILELEDGKNAKIEIVNEGVCYASEGTVSLSIAHIRNKSAPIIHEVTHILAKHEYNSFFSEGLAVYFQERFGGLSGFPNYAAPLDDLLRDQEGQLLQISKLQNDNEIFTQVGTEQRKMAYITAGSFINFLVVKYGEKKLAALHNSNSLNYQEVYEKKFEQLEEEWKNHVLAGSSVTPFKILNTGTGH